VAGTGLASLLSVAAGFIVWVGIALAGGVREAWDQSAWWLVGLSCLAIVAGLMGFFVPARVWRWPVFIVIGQIIGMVLIAVLRSGGGSNLGLLPIMVIFVMLPLVIALTVPALIGGSIALGGWDVRLLF
jgi:hypothetical protein